MPIKRRGNRIDFSGEDARSLAEAIMPNVRGLFSAQEAEAPPEAVPDENIEEGSRVTRKKPGKYLPDTRIGTVLSVDKYGKCKIKWDTAAATGQWHSTVDKKALKKVKE